MTLHYMALLRHDITLHYITSHHITLHYIRTYRRTYDKASKKLELRKARSKEGGARGDVERWRFWDAEAGDAPRCTGILSRGLRACVLGRDTIKGKVQGFQEPIHEIFQDVHLKVLIKIQPV